MTSLSPSQYRTRFAPSPTGYLHVGGARTALFNWLFARHHGGTFVLRVEDTDEARNTPAARAAILDGLQWLGIDWDEGPLVDGKFGPYYQSERKPIYDEYFERLRRSGHVYEEENGSMRFRFSRQPRTVHDLICGDCDFTSQSTHEPDMTVRRPDGSYIFHFVNVVDDLEMKITHVLRGEDHISNTWKHLELFEALGAEPPVYGHIPLILNPDGSKMSKRDQGASLGEYKENGFLPQAVLNYLCLTGWSPGGDVELVSMEEAVKMFDVSHIHSANGRFDIDKCRWFNAHYVKESTPEALLAAARPFLERAKLNWEDDAYAAAAVYSVREKFKLLSEVPDWTQYFFRNDFFHEPEALASLNDPKQKIALQKFAALAGSLAAWDEAALTAAMDEAAAAAGIKSGKLMPALRVALTGTKRGPGVHELLLLLGKERVIASLQRFESL